MAYLATIQNHDCAGPEHGECAKNEDPQAPCVAYNSKQEEYVMQHTSTCANGQCDDIGFEAGAVADIVRRGKIPLVSFTEDVDGRPNFRLVAAKPTDQYFIISHVWADGLGNPEENKLPECQCRRLQKHLKDLRQKSYEITKRDTHRWISCTEYLRRLPIHRQSRIDVVRQGSEIGWVLRKITLMWHYRFWKKDEDLRYKQSPHLFWMDTFCIPVSENDLRQKAIANMARVYAKAEMMLVLTKNKGGHAEGELKLPEVLESELHLACSAWMARSWTCQEATLAPDWHIERSDAGLTSRKPYIVNLWKDDLETTRVDFSSCLAKSELTAFYQELSDYAAEKTKRIGNQYMRVISMMPCMPRSFVDVFESFGWKSIFMVERPEQSWGFAGAWNSLVGRTTTYPEDLDSIMAIRLGFIPQAIDLGHTSTEWRMKSIFNSYGSIPLALLYSTGPKIRGASQQDSWIPSYPGIDIVDAQHGEAHVTHEGLEIILAKGPLPHYGLPVYIRAIMIPISALTAGRVCVLLPTLKMKLWVVFFPNKTDPEASMPECIDNPMPPVSLCILLSQLKEPVLNDKSEEDYASRNSIFFKEGACLQVDSISVSALKATFLCAARISMFKPILVDEINRAERFVYPEVVGTLLSNGYKIMLQSGACPSCSQLTRNYYQHFSTLYCGG
jgi:hypothetical protein